MPTFTPIASSTFTGADESPLSEGGVWTQCPGGEGFFARASNTAVPQTAGADCGSYYSGASFANNQYSSGKLSAVGTAGSGTGVGLGVRQSAAAQTFFRFTIDHAASNNAKLSRFVAGAATGLITWTNAFADGDRFWLAIEGLVLFVYDKTLALVQTFNDTGGGGPAGGSPRLVYSSTDTSANVDDWEGGNFSSASASAIPMMGQIAL